MKYRYKNTYNCADFNIVDKCPVGNYTIGAYFRNLEICRLLRCGSHGVTQVHIKERNIQGISVLAFMDTHIIFYTIHCYIPTWQFCLSLEENTLTRNLSGWWLVRLPMRYCVRCVARVVNKTCKRSNSQSVKVNSKITKHIIKSRL